MKLNLKILNNRLLGNLNPILVLKLWGQNEVGFLGH